MASRSYAKGYRFETEIRHKHLDQGIECERVPLSGGAGGSHSGDLKICGETYRAECKARKDGAGFAVLERWLEGNDLLFLKKDRKQPFVAMGWDTYIELMRRANGSGRDR